MLFSLYIYFIYIFYGFQNNFKSTGVAKEIEKIVIPSHNIVDLPLTPKKSNGSDTSVKIPAHVIILSLFPDKAHLL